jgi:carboxypeptidase Taq
MTLLDSYEKLIAHSKEVAYLGSTVAVLHWDQRTQIPNRGHEHRINQLAYLAKMYHQKKTDPVFGELLDQVENSELTGDSFSVEAVNIREWRRHYDLATKIPYELAVELARASAQGQSVWERSRPANDWFSFRPCLEKIVALKRSQAAALGYVDKPYDALLDIYEPYETENSLRPILDTLKDRLADLLNRIKSSRHYGSPDSLEGKFPIQAQKIFCREVAGKIGYDMDAGRLDVSAHPFTTGIGPGDVRITTRYDERSIGEAFFGVVHEVGHALYHQGLPHEHWGQPFCKPVSLGINESQSRFWENMIARSRAFWKHFYPSARSALAPLEGISLERFYRHVNTVSPSLIRTEADEVTYNLHIMVRFELEASLMTGDLAVEDLPEAWNHSMKRYLDVEPSDYKDGLMQDVHWASGSIGYFPTYTLGNLYSAQFYNKIRTDLGDIDRFISSGKFSAILDWLRKKIHSQGARFTPRKLVEEVTGEDLNPEYFINYLEQKYIPIYD